MQKSLRLLIRQYSKICRLTAICHNSFNGDILLSRGDCNRMTYGWSVWGWWITEGGMVPILVTKGMRTMTMCEIGSRANVNSYFRQISFPFKLIIPLIRSHQSILSWVRLQFLIHFRRVKSPLYLYRVNNAGLRLCRNKKWYWSTVYGSFKDK